MKNKHYKGTIVLKLIRTFGLDFCEGNIVKYTARTTKAKTVKERMDDLVKVQTYLNYKRSELVNYNTREQLSAYADWVQEFIKNPNTYDEQDMVKALKAFNELGLFTMWGDKND